VGESSPTGGQHRLPDGIDITIPQPARFWDYLLGGKDNYPIDREVGEQVLAIFPDLLDAARADRGFLVRVVRYLVEEAGIRQLLDIGTGLPTVNNTHQVAQATASECHIVYVDNDPMVLVHARALLTSSKEGRTDYLHADVRDPERILHESTRTLDFTQPIALMLLGIINYIIDSAEAHAIVKRLVNALPPGSYLAMSHPTAEIHSEAIETSIEQYNASGAPPIRTRSRQELTEFFDGLELLEPGVVSCSLWRPNRTDLGTPIEVTQYCGLARKPYRIRSL
jgi:S-adenosyl methyltransferase